jgi:threonine synthase
MKFFPTDKQSDHVSLRSAVLRSIERSASLFMPETLSKLPAEFFEALPHYSLPEIALNVLSPYVTPEVPAKEFEKIVYDAFNFPIPLKRLSESLYSLELFYGPTRAFKDVGARFMAGLIGYFQESEKQKLTIVVATSGDTGGAVASAFHRRPGVQVVILFPKGKVSSIQRKQLTTLGENVHALEINGSFDNCQHLAKQALTDKQLNADLSLSSANSINIARLLPQSLYYYSAVATVGIDHPSTRSQGPLISIPSGNFGNLTAGFFAQRSGLPISQFIAATNANDTIPRYLQSGNFEPKPSIETISNAMDVGNPNNFPRLLSLFDSSYEQFSHALKGYAFNDQQTRQGIKELYEDFNYVADPHGAIGYLGLKTHGYAHMKLPSIFLHTAHPAKFPEVVKEIVGDDMVEPEEFAELRSRKSHATSMEVDYAGLVEFLRELPR